MAASYGVFKQYTTFHSHISGSIDTFCCYFVKFHIHEVLQTTFCRFHTHPIDFIEMILHYLAKYFDLSCQFFHISYYYFLFGTHSAVQSRLLYIYTGIYLFAGNSGTPD